MSDTNGLMDDKEVQSKDGWKDYESMMGGLKKENRGEFTERAVTHILNKHRIYTVRDDERPEMWLYLNGIFEPMAKTFIAEACRKMWGKCFSNHMKNDVIAKIQSDTYIAADVFFKETPGDIIPVQNGILNLKTRELMPFSPDMRFFTKLPITYDKDAKCPAIKQHFRDVLTAESDVNTMFEWFGFHLLREYKYEKAVIMLGSGRNGKGKTLELIKRFVGFENTASVPLQRLDTDPFSKGELHKKLSNIGGDLDKTALKCTGTFKMITGRDTIGAQRKYLTTVNFTNYAKCSFSCNSLPQSYDETRGFMSRWLWFDFPYTFVRKEEFDTMSDTDKTERKIKCGDPAIVDKITTPGEMSGLLNMALDGLDTITKNRGFSNSETDGAIKTKWLAKSNSFNAFCMEHLEEGTDTFVSKPELMARYQAFCSSMRVPRCSEKGIKRVLVESFGSWDTQLMVGDSKGVRVWNGLKFKENSPIPPTQATHPTHGISTFTGIDLNRPKVGKPCVPCVGCVGGKTTEPTPSIVKTPKTFEIPVVGFSETLAKKSIKKALNDEGNPASKIADIIKKVPFKTDKTEELIGLMLRDGELHEVTPGMIRLV